MELSFMDKPHISQILQRRGLTSSNFDLSDVGTYMDYSLYNIDKAVEQYKDVIFKVRRIGILYDVDVDGLCAGHIIRDYSKRLGLNTYWFMNKDKRHGLNDEVLDWVEREGIGYLIVVDAGTNDEDYYNKLNELGVYVLILDHHPLHRGDLLEDYRGGTGTVVVNCKYDGSPNVDLSGTGVVYRFIEELDKEFYLGGIEKYRRWVGLSVFSDSCNILNKENMYYVQDLYDSYEDEILFTYYKNYGSLNDLYNYKVIPLLNAVIRMNRGDLAVSLIEETNETRLGMLVEEAQQVREDQNSKIDAMLTEGVEYIEGNDIVVCTTKDLSNRVVFGLTANKLREKYSKGVLILGDYGDRFSGSFRGTVGVETSDLVELGVTNLGGHPRAAGVEIKRDEFKEVVTRLLTADLNREESAVSDIELSFIELYKGEADEVLYDIALLNEYAGNGFPKVVVHVKNIEIQADARIYPSSIVYTYGSFEVVDFEVYGSMLKGVNRTELLLEPVLSDNELYRLVVKYV